MKRSSAYAAVAGSVLLLAALVSCGGDDGSTSDSAADSPTTEAAASGSEEYCASLEEAKSQFEQLGPTGAVNFEDSLDTLREVGELAPEEVAGDWQTMLGFFDKFEQAVKDAGLTFEELESLQQNPSQLPKGVDAQAVQEFVTTVQGLGAAEVEQAGKAISEHAKAECDIELGASSSGSDQQSQ